MMTTAMMMMMMMMINETYGHSPEAVMEND